MIQPLLANAGIPMIFLAMPVMALLIIPVIFVEVLASKKIINREKPGKVWAGIAVANVFSTFIGWPMAWALLVGLQLATGGGGAHGLDSPLGLILSVTQQAPWLIPYESSLYWMIPAAMGFLLVPFFFVSVYSERFILNRMWTAETKAAVQKFSWRAHFFSYAFLALVVTCYAFYTISRHG